MVLLSRSFIWKRVVSLATTVSVTATSFALAQDPASTREVPSKENPFLTENASAMKRMMADMMIKPSGNVDRDFVAMMVPHHQGAVDMAKAELEYGHNEQLRQLAREIVATQQREITEMRSAISEDGSSAAQPTEQPRRGLSSPTASAGGMVAPGAMKMPQ
jgi:uncharacterized protein (DUF305 family)